MRIICFRTETSGVRVGAQFDNVVADLHAADKRIPPDLLGLIRAGERGLDLVREVEANLSTINDRAIYEPGEVRLVAPWTGKRIAMSARNHAVHALGSQRGSVDIHSRTPEEMTKEIRKLGPVGFWKTLEWVTDPDGELVYPRGRTTLLDYEGEVGVIFSSDTKRIRAENVSDHIWGVTLMNDWSSRDDSPMSRSHTYDLRKNFDGSLSVGPCIVVGELDPQQVDVLTTVNGELRQQYNTREMVFSFGECVESLTRDLTLVAGDMMGSGTGPGTAIDTVGSAAKNQEASRKLFLKPGDIVEVSSPEIGELKNKVVEIGDMSQ